MPLKQYKWKSIELHASIEPPVETAVVKLESEGERVDLVFDSLESMKALGMVLMGAYQILSKKSVH